MRTISSLFLSLLLVSIGHAQIGRREIPRLPIDEGQLPEPRMLPLTFTNADGRPPVSSETPEGATTYFGRYTMSKVATEYMFAIPGEPDLIEFVCADYSVDLMKRAVTAKRLIAARAGNLVLIGAQAEAVGDQLAVTATVDKEAVLYRLSSNKFGGTIEEVRGKKIVVNLKSWSATADGGESKKLAPPPAPK